MTRAVWDRLLAEARAWHSAIPAMREFVPWPDDLTYQQREPVQRPVVTHLRSAPGRTDVRSRALCNALVESAPYAEWRHTYSEEEVGADFLNRYGWFELAGPEGHFHTAQTRLTVGYWGPGLYYGRHQHEPEELYSVVSGSAEFHMDGVASRMLGPGETQFHPSNCPHAMTTTDEPVLTFVLWRGDGLADAPRMTPT